MRLELKSDEELSSSLAMLWLTKFVIRTLELAGRHLPPPESQHQLTGKRGELAAYFHLRKLGYKMVAANFRVPFNRGEIDLIGWDGGTLCFIEVKTRTRASFAPPETAVDREKRKHILSVARHYVRRLPGERPPCRFDIVSVVAGEKGREPAIMLHRGAFSWDSDKPRGHSARFSRDFHDWHLWPRRR